MLQNPMHKGKLLCSKCSTYYEKSLSECPFCGNGGKKESNELQQKRIEKVNADLSAHLRSMSLSNKELVLRFIENKIA